MAIVVIDGKKFDNVKIAATKEEQAKGLMNVKSPYLLLFPYKKAGVKKFWMKNTFVALDIIFCKAGTVIYICKGEPFNKKPVGPSEDVDLVLEASFGFTDYHNIVVGSKIRPKYNKEELQHILKNGSL